MRYRVECNRGSKYFSNAAEAFAYYAKCREKNLDVEIWLVDNRYIEKLGRFGAVQELLDYAHSDFPKH